MTPEDTSVVYAGLVTRAIALVIDALVICGVTLAVSGAVLLVKSVFSIGHIDHALVVSLGIGLYVVWVVGYFAVFWTTTGQTLGGRVMQIQVTRSDGSPLRPAQALVRLVGMVLSMPLFWGYLPILWSPRRRGVCDLVAGTVVTGVEPGPPELESPAQRQTRSRHREPAREYGPANGTGLDLHPAAERRKTVA